MEKTRILLVGMPSSHFFRWVSHIYLDKFELYWYNILNMPYEEKYNLIFKKIYFTKKKRKIGYIKGEFFLSKKFPGIYNLLRPHLEITENKIVEEIIREVEPEIVHSLEMQSCTYPIIGALKNFSKQKWIYSCWGSDLFYYQNLKNHKRLIKKALKGVNFIHTDNFRDQKIARSLGFKGTFTEVILGGGGYDTTNVYNNFKPLHARKYILVKGYEHRMGRSINVIKALQSLKSKGFLFEIVIFGAYPKLIEYLKTTNFKAKVYRIKEIDHQRVLELMGNSFVYIGNSISDGMPNTLIEAFLMGTYPVQSNPGGATAELVDHKINGCLINDPENINEIETLIKWVLEHKSYCDSKVLENHKYATEEFSFKKTQIKINSLYKNVAVN